MQDNMWNYLSNLILLAPKNLISDNNIMNQLSQEAKLNMSIENLSRYTHDQSLSSNYKLRIYNFVDMYRLI